MLPIASNPQGYFSSFRENPEISYSVSTSFSGGAINLLNVAKIHFQKLLGKIESYEKKISPHTMHQTIITVNYKATHIEKIFNILACIPLVCSFSSPLRIIAGKLQIIAGGILAGIAEVFLAIRRIQKTAPEKLTMWKKISKAGTEHILHGCLNMIRGTTEGIFGSITLGIGSLILLVPNLQRPDSFAPYYEYGILTKD